MNVCIFLRESNFYYIINSVFVECDLLETARMLVRLADVTEFACSVRGVRNNRVLSMSAARCHLAILVLFHFTETATENDLYLLLELKLKIGQMKRMGIKTEMK